MIVRWNGDSSCKKKRKTEFFTINGKKKTKTKFKMENFRKRKKRDANL